MNNYRSHDLAVVLISASRLKKRLRDSDLLLVDARSWHDYSGGHIPHAINLDLFAFHWADTSEDGIRAFNRQTVKLLANAGVSYDRQVVFYDGVSGIFAARGVWLLEYFSHRNASMLDGGFAGWKKAGYEIEKRANPYRPAAFRPKADSSVLATYRYILRNLGNPKVKIVDARSRDEYSGRSARAARGGRIPNAINVDWETNLGKDNMFKDTPALRRLYKRVGKNDEVICYCQGGYRAANDYVALKKLGYKNVRVYLGSWYEWGNMPELPVEV